MNLFESEYTAEDWINGKVNWVSIDWAPLFPIRKFKDSERDLFKNNEYEKLKKLREEAFDIGVQNNVKLYLKVLEESIENLNPEEKLKQIDEEIEYCDVTYEKFSHDVRHDIRLGRKELTGLSPNRYKKILEINLQNPTSPVSLDHDQFGNEPDASVDHQVMRKNQWFEISVNRGYCTALIKLKEELNEKANNNSTNPKYMYTDEQLTSAEGKIDYITNIYNIEQVTWERALEIANNVTNRTLYKNVKSFQNARRNLRIRKA